MPVTIHELESRVLTGNALGDPATRRIPVYLPPGYDKESSREGYPVVYFLAGFSGGGTLLLNETLWGENLPDRLDRLAIEAKWRERWAERPAQSPVRRLPTDPPPLDLTLGPVRSREEVPEDEDENTEEVTEATDVSQIAAASGSLEKGAGGEAETDSVESDSSESDSVASDAQSEDRQSRGQRPKSNAMLQRCLQSPRLARQQSR